MAIEGQLAMMLTRAIVISVPLIMLLAYSCASARHKCALPVEAEDGNGGREQTRSEASGEVSVALLQGEELFHQLHLSDTRNSCYVELLSVTYSNDGPADTISVSLNGSLLGTFNSTEESNSGHNWNVFYEENIDNPFRVYINNGQSQLKSSAVATDSNGVEIDYLLLELYCPQEEIVGECPLSPVIKNDCIISSGQNHYDYVPVLEILTVCCLVVSVCGMVSGYCFFTLKLLIFNCCCKGRKSTREVIELKSFPSHDDKEPI